MIKSVDCLVGEEPCQLHGEGGATFGEGHNEDVVLSYLGVGEGGVGISIHNTLRKTVLAMVLARTNLIGVFLLL